MFKPNFHKQFQLNGNSFTSEEELLLFTENLSEESAEFLKDWFAETTYVKVKTSGSTGVPKIIKLKKENMVNSALATGAYFNLPEKTTALLCLSSNYIAGKMMWVRALVLGWHLDISETNSNPLLNLSKEYDFSAMVPIQVHHALPNLSKIKKLIIGGGVVSSELMKALKNVKTRAFSTYGMTETITHIAVKKLNFYSENEKINYQTLPGVSITKDDRGCLVIKAPKVSDEIVITNDLVALMDANNFQWLGRYDSIINSGGIKLIPEQLEGKLSKHITERFFISSLPDEVLGEKLILIVEAKRVSITKKEEILAYLKGANLTKFEVPKRIFFLPEFIETETKKIQRSKTKELILNNI